MATRYPASLSRIARTGRVSSKVLSCCTAVLLCPLTIALLAGCGDSSKKSAGTQAQAAPPLENGNQAVAQGQAQAQAPEGPRQPFGKPAPAPNEAEAPAVDPNLNPHDVFEVTATMSTFERVDGPEGPASVDKFDAVFPAKGSDSSDFELTETPQEKPTTRFASPPMTAETQTARQSEKPTSKRRSSAKSSDKNKADKDKLDTAADKSEGDSKKSLPSGFRVISESGYSPVGWPLRIRSKIDRAEMALVTGGAVTVGHDGDPPESSPQITVVLDSFYMDVAEVTLARYERYRKQMTEEHGRRAVPEPENVKSPPDFPVLGVTLKQAEFYCHWAQKDLPTEAEWERAARGEQAFAHPWGNGRAIWSQARKPNTITAVKSFGTDVSPYGIYDLAGNAREWCSDRWSETAFADAQKGSQNPLRNWKGPRNAPADVHVVKGNGPGWDAWYRAGLNGTQHHPNVGFRCVLRLSEKN